MDCQFLAGQIKIEGYAMRARAPVRLIESHTVPRFPSLVQHLVQTHAPTLNTYIPQQTPCDQQSHKSIDINVPSDQTPIEPTVLIVLTICVVVASLRAAYFVAH